MVLTMTMATESIKYHCIETRRPPVEAAEEGEAVRTIKRRRRRRIKMKHSRTKRDHDRIVPHR